MLRKIGAPLFHLIMVCMMAFALFAGLMGWVQ